MSKIIRAAASKAGRVGALRGLLPDLALLARLAVAYGRGDYRDVSRRTVVLGVLTAAYLVTPIDLIPDFIPVVGFLDDVAVVGFLLKRIAGDLERFAEWERGRQRRG
jgi:uncharacterized membrane protein YkvA (DUF1232 family)